MEDSRVYASQQVQSQTIRLSLCDVYSPKVWVAQTHFWTLPANIPSSRAYHLLKEGLSRTLSEIPALIGTTQRASEDPRDLFIQVESSNYIDIAYEDFSSAENVPSYSTLANQGFLIDECIGIFSPPISLMPVFEGAPMLTAKLNALNGGLAFTFAYNHLLADASSFAVIETLWAKHTADISQGIPERKHRQFNGDEEIRKRLSTPRKEAGAFEHEHWKVFPTANSVLNLSKQTVPAEADLTILDTAKKAHLASVGVQLEEVKWCIWSLSAESQARLRKDASDPTGEVRTSTMDAVIGLFWSRLAYVKQSSHQGHDSSLALFPISIRPRLDPPVPAEYIGNAIDISFAQCSISRLETVGIAGTRAAAKCIRKAVNGWTQSTWSSWLNLAASLPNDQAICPNSLSILEPQNMVSNDYSRSPAQILDWGSELKRIDRTRYLQPASSMSNCATAVVVNPRLADGGLEVVTSCNDQLRDALQCDSVLLQYASLVNGTQVKGEYMLNEMS